MCVLLDLSMYPYILCTNSSVYDSLACIPYNVTVVFLFPDFVYNSLL